MGRWPEFFRGRLRVLYELTGKVRYGQRRASPRLGNQRSKIHDPAFALVGPD